MNQLQLTYTSNTTNLQLVAKIDSLDVEVNYTNGCIDINCNLTQGFHLLEIELVNAQPADKIEFVSAELDGVSFKHTIYTMFNNEGRQSTALTLLHNKVSLPFMNPLAWWFSACASKIPNKYYGGGLYDNLTVYYPQSIRLDKQYNKIITDFFRENMEFYVHPTYTIDQAYYRRDVPYILVGDQLSYDEPALLAEFLDNLEFLNLIL
jgi:hypothetical protein